MSLLDLIRTSVIERDTAATSATTATVRDATPETVARVATVARERGERESLSPQGGGAATVARVATVATGVERREKSLSSVETVATVATVAGCSRRNRGGRRGVEAKVDELRRLLSALLWDAPHEVEDEVRRTLDDGALDEALECYGLAYIEYARLEELPGQRHHKVWLRHTYEAEGYLRKRGSHRAVLDAGESDWALPAFSDAD
jgi:hypothetical protein